MSTKKSTRATSSVLRSIRKKYGVPSRASGHNRMQKIVVAFDIDGTLRCNCTDTCQDTNENVAKGLEFFNSLKNTRVIIWSGSGKDYAVQWGKKFGISEYRCFSKLDAPKVDIAIDDQQEFALATFNLIVREK